ncbi:MAG: hypothetical protein LBQ74_17755, partial [Prevotella sp.]|nr:hypothetical protein [Prevotella sp.]
KIPRKIRGIIQYGNGDAFAYFGDDKISCLNIRPVPLTEDILSKAGFVLDAKGNIYRSESCNFEIKKGDDDYYITCNGGEIHISSVLISSLHQLQNIYFELTGKELDIEL